MTAYPFPCPECGRGTTIKHTNADKRYRACPHCGHKFNTREVSESDFNFLTNVKAAVLTVPPPQESKRR